jgi:hypothetical protein
VDNRPRRSGSGATTNNARGSQAAHRRRQWE